MKKLILLVVIFTLAMAMCETVTAIAQTPPPPNPYNNTIGTTIIFWPKPKPGKPHPRGASFAPITGTYDISSQSINLSIMEDLGEMTVTVINHSTGEQSFEFIDSAFESAEVYVSCDEGQYSIFIEAQDGNSYYAEFIIS